MTRNGETHRPDGNPGLRLAALLLAWFAAAYVIGAEGLAVNAAGAVFPPIALTAIVPVAAFLLVYALSERLRAFVLSADIRRLTMLQHWRVVGFAFLPLSFFDVLPGLFAWPAGLGDVAVGLGAALMVARLDRDPDAVTSHGLVRFHLLGLLDFAAAIGTATLASGAFPVFAVGTPTSAAMNVWPLNLFPSFLVPIFIILHVVVLLKVRHLRRLAMRRGAVALRTA